MSMIIYDLFALMIETENIKVSPLKTPYTTKQKIEKPITFNSYKNVIQTRFLLETYQVTFHVVFVI